MHRKSTYFSRGRHRRPSLIARLTVAMFTLAVFA